MVDNRVNRLMALHKTEQTQSSIPVYADTHTDPDGRYDSDHTMSKCMRKRGKTETEIAVSLENPQDDQISLRK